MPTIALLLAALTLLAHHLLRPPLMPTIIIVGSGLAGISAAHEALRAGSARVYILDHAAKPGGNSIKASSGINGAGTPFQSAGDSSGSFYDDTVRSAGGRFHNPLPSTPSSSNNLRSTLIKTLTQNSPDAVSWLSEEFGIDLSVVTALGGHSIARTHRGAGKTPPGADIITHMLAQLKTYGDRFVLESSTQVISLVRNSVAASTSTAISGVEYIQNGKTHTLTGAVVFAAGGFAGDTHGLVTQHRPDLAGLPSTNEQRPAPHAILQDAGAALVDMDSIQVHPTGFIDPKHPESSYKFLAAEALRGEGGILINTLTGGRFVNEMGTREQVSRAIMALPPLPSSSSSPSSPPSSSSQSFSKTTRQWPVTLVLDPGASEALAGHLAFYLFKGFLVQKKVGELPPAMIQAIDDYAVAVATDNDTIFGRTSFGRWCLPPGEANRNETVCVGAVTPVLHFTMGGAAFDADARVLQPNGQSIRGLWAAGEVTGGVHGDNRLAGSSLLECVVFGRIAGRAASIYARSL